MTVPVKQSIGISFAQGLDTKIDPKRIQIGKFLYLYNSVFNKGGLLQKRNGYAKLPSLPDTSSTYLTTYRDNLTAIGTSIQAFNPSNASWISKGSIQPMNMSTLPLLRNNLNQMACDAVVAPNGLVCTVYIESNGSTQTNKYAISNVSTGQNIITPVAIPVSSGTVSGGMRVFLLGTNFIIVFTNTISATTHLQYITINSTQPTLVGANLDIASAYDATTNLSWDGIVANNNLYIAYNNPSGSQSVKIIYLNISLILSSPTTLAGYKASCMSICADATQTSSNIYVSFYDSSASKGYTAYLDQFTNVLMKPVLIIPSGVIVNITSSAQNGAATIFYETTNAYSYDSSLPTNFISKVIVTPLGRTFNSVFSSGVGTITVSSATGLVNGMTLVDNTTSGNIDIATTFTVSGTTLTLSKNTLGNSASSPGDQMSAATVSAAVIVIRSVGLASKSFIVNSVIYFLSAYQSSYQPTYFLINGSTSLSSSPVISAKVAYENGGGYLTQGLPFVTVTAASNLAQIPYLFKDLITAVNKDTNVPSGTQINGIYSQTGINLVNFVIGTSGIDTSEIGSDLHLSGGYLTMYDGQIPVEHNFFLWPDNIEATWTANSVVTPTGTFSSGSKSVVVSSATGIFVGMSITDTSNATYIPANTFVTAISGTILTITNATTHAAAGDNLSIQGNIHAQPDSATNANAYFYQVTYEWTDNQGNAFRSAPSIPIAVTTTGAGSSGTIALTGPNLRLTAKVISSIKIVIYRWSVAQQIYYQTTSIISPLLNNTTTDSWTFVDTLPDSSILGNNIIYTNGGVVEDVNAPATNIMTLFDNRLWLVDAEDANLLWYSKEVIENTPVEMSDLFTLYIAPTTAAQGPTGPISAASPMDDKLCLFKRNSILYINGTGPDNTGQNSQYSQPIFITSTVGCTNQQSIVFIPNGLMFQSDKGIWLLGRDLNTSYIGAPVDRYKDDIVKSAQTIPGTNQVRFILSSGVTLMYDYYYDQWGVFTGVPAISSCIYNQLQTFINSNGSVYQENPGSYLDGANPVLMSFITGPLRLGDLQNFQRTYFYYLLGDYVTPHKLYVSNYYDYSTSPSDVRLISPTNFSPNYGGSSPYGQQNPYGGPGNAEDWRIFANRRCMALSIGVQEIYDPSFGIAAGAGLTLSGINLVVGMKAPFKSQSAANSVG